MTSRFSLDNRLACVALSFVAAAAVTMIHVKAVDLPNRDFQARWHQSVIDGRAPAPDQYRLLTFALAEGLRRLSGADLIEVYAALRLAFTSAAFFVLYRYLRQWFFSSLAAAGVLIVASALPVTFFGYRMQVTDPAQFLFFLLAFRALQTDRPVWLYVLAPLAAANRETALLVIPFCIAAWWKNVRPATILVRTAAVTALMLAVLVPIHLAYGAHQPYAPLFALRNNLSTFRTIIFPGILLGWMLVPAFAGLDRKPTILRRWLVPAGIFVGVHLVLARLDEARLLLPVVPVVLPLALFSLGDRQGDCIDQNALSPAA